MTGWDTVSNYEELFASDGTAAGTICPTPPSMGDSPFYPWEAWVPFNNALYYKAAYGYFADYQLCRYTETKPSGIVTNNESPKAFVLYQNYPNPFNPATLINYSLPKESLINISIYNCIGELVKNFDNKIESAGNHNLSFDGSRLSSGVYFYTLRATSVDGNQNFTNTKKMILLK
jgi:hypothetical protein